MPSDVCPFTGVSPESDENGFAESFMAFPISGQASPLAGGAYDAPALGSIHAHGAGASTGPNRAGRLLRPLRRWTIAPLLFPSAKQSLEIEGAGNREIELGAS